MTAARRSATQGVPQGVDREGVRGPQLGFSSTAAKLVAVSEALAAIWPLSLIVLRTRPPGGRLSFSRPPRPGRSLRSRRMRSACADHRTRHPLARRRRLSAGRGRAGFLTGRAAHRNPGQTRHARGMSEAAFKDETDLFGEQAVFCGGDRARAGRVPRRWCSSGTQDSSTSQKAKPSRMLTSPTSTAIGSLKIGPACTKVWNSPFSPQGSTPAGSSDSSRSS
jgi:hypothetical protein